MRKIIVYQKYATKPIILTDASTQSEDDLKKKIINVFESKNISILETESDILISRPSEIQSILITKSSDLPKEPKND